MTEFQLMGIILVACFIVFIYYLLTLRRNKSSAKKLLNNYDESQDCSKQGEKHRRRLLGEGGSPDNGKPIPEQFVEPKGRQLLQTAVANKPRKNSTSIRKSSKSPRGIFRKLQRK